MDQSLATQYAPCPKCNATTAEKMSFTWRGGVIGPKVLSHVKCGSCSAQYNGKSGKDNTTGIIIYSVVVGAIVLGLLVVVVAIAIMAMTMG